MPMIATRLFWMCSGRELDRALIISCITHLYRRISIGSMRLDNALTLRVDLVAPLYVFV